MQWRLGEVFEDEDHVELLQAELHTLERRNLDFTECDDKERRVGQVYKTLCRRVQPYVRTERYTFKRQLAEGNVGLESLPSLTHQISA